MKFIHYILIGAIATPFIAGGIWFLKQPIDTKRGFITYAGWSSTTVVEESYRDCRYRRRDGRRKRHCSTKWRTLQHSESVGRFPSPISYPALTAQGGERVRYRQQYTITFSLPELEEAVSIRDSNDKRYRLVTTQTPAGVSIYQCEFNVRLNRLGGVYGVPIITSCGQNS